MAHGQQLLLARLAAGGEVIDGTADVLQRQAHVLAGSDVVLQLDVAVGPEVDLPDQALVDGGQRLVHGFLATGTDFFEVLGHEVRRSMGQRDLLQVLGDPGCGQHILDQRHVSRR